MKILALALALVLGLIPAFTTPAFAVDSEFNIDFTDFYEDSIYRFCMAEEGSLPVRENCIDHTGKELASGMYPYFIAVDAQPGLRLVFYVEDITNHMIYQRTIGDSEENPEDLYFSMIPLQRPGTIQFAEEGVQTETQTETVTETETQTGTTTWTDPKTGLVYDIPTQGDYCLDFDEDSVCDIDFTDGKQVVYDTETETQVEDAVGESGKGNGNRNGDSDANPYCDKLNDEQKSNTVCHDRRDVDSETGIATCNDGTHKKDWRDCKDASGYDYNDEGNSDDQGREEEEEEDQNCGGESCTDDEKEDSTTDEDDNLYGSGEENE